MALLGAGIPLTLLLDLAGPARPGSREIARSEGGEADWLLAYRRLTASAAPRP
jgi:hypothetical protein